MHFNIISSVRLVLSNSFFPSHASVKLRQYFSFLPCVVLSVHLTAFVLIIPAVVWLASSTGCGVPQLALPPSVHTFFSVLFSPVSFIKRFLFKFLYGGGYLRADVSNPCKRTNFRATHFGAYFVWRLEECNIYMYIYIYMYVCVCVCVCVCVTASVV